MFNKKPSRRTTFDKTDEQMFTPLYYYRVNLNGTNAFYTFDTFGYISEA